MEVGLAELEVASMKEDVDEVDIEEVAEDVVDGETGWTTSFFGVLLVEEVVDEVDDVDVGVEVVVGVELVLALVLVLVVSATISSNWAGVGVGVGVGMGVGVGVGVGMGVGVVVVVGDATAALLSLFLLLFDSELSGVAGAVMYPPIGPSNVLAAVW